MKTQIASSSIINDWGLLYVNQLIDTKGDSLIIQRQLKSLQGLSCKRKKAKWLSEIERKMLKTQESREIQNQYKINSYNTQALKIKQTKISEN